MNTPAGHDSGLLPVCFMIMPFRRKKVPAGARDGAPHEIDFDALWDRAYRLAIADVGYTPIRADADTGSVIVKDMLERIAFADLVIADVSLPNGNVYYELGLRHAAREAGCIMFAADWSRQLFDIDQFTTVRYALSDGDLPPSEAERIRTTVAEAIPTLRGSRTPWHEFIPVDDPSPAERTVFRSNAKRLGALQAEMRSIRLMGDREVRQKAIQGLRARLPVAALGSAAVALELLSLIRDTLGWAEVLAFTTELPTGVAELPFVQEQRLLALANEGEPEHAIAQLEELMRQFGETPERHGLIGGRYKRLWRTERDRRRRSGGDLAPPAERRALGQAIRHYTAGMELDYNQYFCSSNIAQLLLARAEEGDEERAVVVDQFVVAACERAIDRDEDDEWTRPTLLGAAFRSGDEDKARELTELVGMEGPAAWKLRSTIDDLKEAVDRLGDAEAVPVLRAVLEDLESLLA